MELPAASAHGVVKGFGASRARRLVLNGVDLDVRPRELVAVLGRSGSGKSTLLHLFAGLDRPDRGEIVVAGVSVHRAGEAELVQLRRRRVGLVFQFFHLVPELTGLENILLPADMAGDSASANVRAHSLIERLGVQEVADQLPATLSGGEQQRLAVARAVINDPGLILADEPTGNLDADSGRQVLRLLREIADDGRAVLLMTHDPEAGALADRVLHLREGRLEP